MIIIIKIHNIITVHREIMGGLKSNTIVNTSYNIIYYNIVIHGVKKYDIIKS